jgi:hypothetical protein
MTLIADMGVVRQKGRSDCNPPLKVMGSRDYPLKARWLLSHSPETETEK